MPPSNLGISNGYAHHEFNSTANCWNIYLQHKPGHTSRIYHKTYCILFQSTHSLIPISINNTTSDYFEITGFPLTTTNGCHYQGSKKRPATSRPTIDSCTSIINTYLQTAMGDSLLTLRHEDNGKTLIGGKGRLSL